MASNRQNEIAEILEALLGRPESLTADQRSAVDEGLADVDANRFALPEEVEAFFAKYRTT